MAILLSRPVTCCPKPSLIGQTVAGRYFVESRIGRGTFGNVYKVVDLESSSLVDGCIHRAMKVIDVADPNPPRIPPPHYVNRKLTHAAREIHFHQLVSSHPNIVTLHQSFFLADREEMFLIMDYCAGGDLRTYISKGRNRFTGDDRRLKRVLLQICDAVDFIHTKGVFHKDLKPQNILISRDGWKISLCDFGLATDARTDARGGGTTPYMSPELLDTQRLYCPRRADAWALGIVVLNMLGISPWRGATAGSKRFRNFMLVDDHLLQARPISPEANDLIRDILRFDPELRLSVPEISTRALQIRSFFDSPRTKLTPEEVLEMKCTHQRMFERLDPIARRRKDLEHFMGMDEILPFDNHDQRLPQLQRTAHVFRSPQQLLPGAVRPHCARISGIPPPVTIRPKEPVARDRKWWHVDSLKLVGGRFS